MPGPCGVIASKSELATFKAAARATALKDCRVNIRLSSGDLCDIQVKALEEGIPCQTLIAGVLHKYMTERPARRQKVRRQSAAFSGPIPNDHKRPAFSSP